MVERAPWLVECRISPDKLDPAPAEAFRALYPEGSNFVVTPRAAEPHRIRRRDLVFTVCSTHHLQAARTPLRMFLSRTASPPAVVGRIGRSRRSD